MSEIPPYTDAIPGVDPVIVDFMKQQLDLAQSTYDPSGIFYQQRQAEYAFTVVRDAISMDDIPHIYRSPKTRLSAVSTQRHDVAEPFVSTTINTGEFSDTFSTLEPDQTAPIRQLLQAIVQVQLEEFRDRPQAVMEALGRLPYSQRHLLQRRVVQKTFDPQGTETDALHLTLHEMSMPNKPLHQGYGLNFGRPVTIDGTSYVYWQHMSCDEPQRRIFYGHRQAFAYNMPFRLGKHYQTGVEAIELPLDGQASSGIMSLNGLEAYLSSRGNLLVGQLARTEVNRLLMGPLDDSLRLR